MKICKKNGGVCNSIYLIQYQEENSFLLKETRKDFCNFFLLNSAKKERMIMDMIYEQDPDLSLPYKFIDERNGKRRLLMDFYENSINLGEFRQLTKKILVKVRDLIIRLQKVKLNGKKKRINKGEGKNNLKNVAFLSSNVRSGKLIRLYSELMKFLFRYENSSAADFQSLVLSHNDLVPGNILYLPEDVFCLIDGEYSSLNNKLFDIASFAAESLVGRGKKGRSKGFEMFSLSSSERVDLLKGVQYHDLFGFYGANYFFVKSGRRNRVLFRIRREKYRACLEHVKIYEKESRD